MAATVRDIDRLNIGLMLASCALAWILPFDVFLAAYAVLGPLHYLTEIQWLHDRRYFIGSRWLFAIFAALVLGVSLLPAVERWSWHMALGRGIALVFVVAAMTVLVRTPWLRWTGLALAAPICLTAATAKFHVFFSVLLPTIIHVFVFTAAFILVGAMKNRSGTGVASLVTLAACAASFVLSPALEPVMTRWAAAHYSSAIGGAHVTIASFAGIGIDFESILENPASVAVARFIAFAYTYHYLNWFSKTSIIGWHRISRARLATTLVIWIAAAGLYFYDYAVGFRVLFSMSVLHVLLEFPLNWQSFAMIAKGVPRRAPVALPQEG